MMKNQRWCRCIKNISCLTYNSGSCELMCHNKIIRLLTCIIVAAVLAVTISHLHDLLMVRDSIEVIRTEIITQQSHLKILTELQKKTREQLKDVNLISGGILNTMQRWRAKNAQICVSQLRDIENKIKKGLNMTNFEDIRYTDYALEVSGGSILSVRDTKTFDSNSYLSSYFNFLPFCQFHNNPRLVIQNNKAPGQCWAFKGSVGCIAIKLISPIYVTSVTLEHITVHESPNSKTISAPRYFSVWGLKSINDKEGYFFGKFIYDNCASPIQNFPMKKKSNELYEIVELRIHSNSGNPNYTCLYRVRVHGEINL